MRFTTLSAAALALAASVFAQTDGFDAITSPTKDEEVKAGSTFTIKWEPGTYTKDTVSISLIGGASASTLVALGDNGVVATGIDNKLGEYAWAVDASKVGSYAVYGLEITLDSDAKTFQYSYPFKIVGGGSSSSASGSASITGSASKTSGTASSTATSSSATGKTTDKSTSTKTSGSGAAVSSSAVPTAASSVAAGNATTLYTMASSGAPAGSSAAPSGTASANPAKTTNSSGAERIAAGAFAVLTGLAAVFFTL